MEVMSVGEVSQKAQELLNRKVSVSGFSFEPTLGPKIHIGGKEWFSLKNGSGQMLCLANPKDVGKGKVTGYVRREAGINYLEV